jgi:hypothetical protein
METRVCGDALRKRILIDTPKGCRCSDGLTAVAGILVLFLEEVREIGYPLARAMSGFLTTLFKLAVGGAIA